MVELGVGSRVGAPWCPSEPNPNPEAESLHPASSPSDHSPREQVTLEVWGLFIM